ncbi:MAG TPA: superoxide dismutase family protein [Thermoanaerobaculia bacterium]|nr:superoxide dismutase family protein [Thermoanaerobaculia bacterium]
MKRVLVILASTLVVAACASSRGPMAMATLAPTTGNTAKGTVHFTDVGDGNVEVQIDLTGVPAGTHGFHLHEKGACGNNGNDAGGHFNPTGMIHGAPDAVSHHAGDFGNVTADANGEVHTRITTHSISLKPGDPTNPVGHAVILHANPDDLVTQPSGNAGARIACGVVQTTGSM